MSRRLLPALLLAAGLCAGAGLAHAADSHDAHGGGGKVVEPEVDLKTSLAGKTISFLANISYDVPVVREWGKGASSIGSLLAIVLLRDDGAARIKRWNSLAGVYDPVDAGTWSIEDKVLCLMGPWPTLHRDRFCMDIRVYGPIMAGHGTNVSALIKGDIRAGNPDGL
jgi:hypothetical protein